MSFLPKNYEQPQAKSNYFSVSKLKDKTDNVIRILSKPIMGWLDWKEVDGKKVPVRTPFNEPCPEPIDKTKPVKHFWAMIVWDYRDKTVKIMEITQATIQEAIYNLDCDEGWGEPMCYDLNIKRTGEKLETKYFITPRPPKELEEEIKTSLRETNPNLQALFTNENPFDKKEPSDTPPDFLETTPAELRSENIPF
jgi:hypothetical protein